MNPFDQFDPSAVRVPGANPFDQFDAQTRNQPIDQQAPQDLTFAEKYLAPILDKFGAGAQNAPVIGDLASEILNNGNTRGSALGGVLQAWADQPAGAVQFAANAVSPLVSSAANAISPGSGDVNTLAGNVNAAIANQNQQYEAARAQAGRGGFDAARRVVGAMTTPANILLGGQLSPAVGLWNRAVQGGTIAGGLAAAAPVEDTTNKSYWNQKSLQVPAAALFGAIATPAIGAAMDQAAPIVGKAVDWLTNKLGAPVSTLGPTQVDAAINEGLKETGQTIDDIPTGQLASLRQQVSDALNVGKVVDPAALMRKADFDSLNVPYTLGDITRDPAQVARESRLAAVEGTGQPLVDIAQQKGAGLYNAIAAPSAGAQDAYNAGTQLVNSSENSYNVMHDVAGGLYKQARASAGKDLLVDPAPISQAFPNIIERFGNADLIPKGVQDKLISYGIDPVTGVAKAPLTFDQANSLSQTINALDPGKWSTAQYGKATNAVLNELRSGIRASVNAADSQGGPFAPAVAAWREFQQMQEAIPALRASASGQAVPETFVNRYIISAPADEAMGLAKVLKAGDQASFQEAQAQFAAALKKAAYGTSPNVDAPIQQANYNAFLQKPGMIQKLSAFFDADQVHQFLTAGRVAASKQAPTGAMTNPAGTAGNLLSLVSRYIPGGQYVEPVAGAVGHVGRFFAAPGQVSNAVAAQVPVTSAPLSQAQRNYISYLLTGVPAALGNASAQARQ